MCEQAYFGFQVWSILPRQMGTRGSACRPITV
jgi:hypothetical protein